MQKLKLLLAVAMMGIMASCGNDDDNDDTSALDSVEVGPANENDSYKDTATLVSDPNNTLDANPVNDTTVKLDTVH